jgi:hypothetical protein
MKEVVLVMGKALVSQDTLRAVIEASPQGEPNGSKIAKEVLRLLAINSKPENCERGLDGNNFYFMYMKDLTKQYNQALGEDGQVQVRWMAQVLSGIGIKSRHRRNDGMLFMWSQKQLDILNSYFK